MNLLEIIAQLSDLKEIDYRNTLAIAALIELLIEKKVFTREELAQCSMRLDLLGELEAQQASIGD